MLLQVDIGKSPLALLAQTCNSIGLPDTSAKGKAHLAATDNKHHFSLSPKDGKKDGKHSSPTNSTDENGNHRVKDSRPGSAATAVSCKSSTFSYVWTI
jgi:hypothetical protein